MIPKIKMEPLDSNIVYNSDIAGLIKTLKNDKGHDNEKIVTILTRGEIYEDVKKYAKAYAHPLGISELEFLKMARPLRRRWR